MRIRHPSDYTTHPTLTLERQLWQSGCALVGGLDEAGRGAWAGPVFAAIVILPAGCEGEHLLPGVRDSKQMTPSQREYWAGQIRQTAAHWGIGEASPQEIDDLGIVTATRLAMQRAVQASGISPAHLLIDALRLPMLDIPQTALIRGDQQCLSIAAASVLAKTARDAWMRAQEDSFPGYGFAAHKGYGTAQHRAALERLGACPLHRHSFAPVKKLSGIETKLF
ncbi:MAG: ribonuclease HII [Bellilinea sp.]|nr:MAG: ribonuclease HII [Bellilinea sp.]